MLRIGTGLVAAVVVAALCAGTATPAPTASTTLKVMSFNIFYGGDELNLQTRQFCRDPAGCPETLDQVAAAIRASGAYVVGLQEPTMNTRTIAEKLGWNYSERTSYISRFPIIDPPGANGLYVFVEPEPGRVVAVANVHLPADPYGPYEARDGATRADVLQLENELRVPALRTEIHRLPNLAAQGIPVFLTGDFNSPSHLDWTPAVDAVRADVPYPVVWPASKALADAGFVDSFRSVYPNPVARPGFTWTPGSPEGEKVEVHDRIDWVLSMGPATATASSVVGEGGNPNTDIDVDPWPSDHRGLVSTFDVMPAPMPLLAAVQSRSLEQGQTLRVRFHAEGDPGWDVSLLRLRDPVPAATKSTGGAVDGTLSFPTGNLSPGAYLARLIDPVGEVTSQSRFWLYRPGAPTTVTTNKSRYTVGEPIRVSWKKAPGMKWDWLGVYKAGSGADNPNNSTCSAGYCGNGHYLVYGYTHASIQGSRTFRTKDWLAGWKTAPLGNGTYEIRLLLDDGYRSVTSSPRFKIVAP